jgi:uncharacterized protein (DUF433 family)
VTSQATNHHTMRRRARPRRDGAVVQGNLAAGLSADEIVASYPPLRVEDLRAATAYAAELARV